MLPKQVRRGIREIAQNRYAGASELAMAALAVFEDYATSSKTLRRREAKEIATSLRKAQPSMAAVASTAVRCLEDFSKDPSTYRRKLASLRRSYEGAKEKIARRFSRLVKRDSTWVTVSYSSNVIRSLALAHSQIREVYVMESRPLREGRTTARTLDGLGVRTTLVADALGPSMVLRADGVVIGADSVKTDGGVINKIGSLSLALACRFARKPFYVLAERFKVADPGIVGTPRVVPQNPRELVGASSLRGLNLYFEEVPGELVTRILTERGALRVRARPVRKK